MEGLNCLYAELISDDHNLKFTQGPAKSFVPDYQSIGGERKLQNIKKLMIITDNPVNQFNAAVAFKVVKPEDITTDIKIAETGKLYTWKDMKSWILE